MTFTDGFLQAALFAQAALPLLMALLLLGGRIPRSWNLSSGLVVLLACLALLVILQAATSSVAVRPFIALSPADIPWVPRTWLQEWRSGLRTDAHVIGLLMLCSALTLTALMAERRENVRHDQRHVAAWLMLQCLATLMLTAEHAGLRLAAGGLLALLLASIIGAWGGGSRRTAAARLLGIQWIALISLGTGLALASGVVSLMQAAPYGIPQATTLNIPRLVDLYGHALRRHPAAEPVLLQLADWLLLSSVLPIWLAGALFPLHGWFQEVWSGSPASVRIWLGGIGIKLPFVTLFPLWSQLLGARGLVLLYCCAWSAIFGLLIAAYLSTAFREEDRVGASLTLISAQLVVLLGCIGPQGLLMALLTGAAGVTLFVLSSHGGDKAVINTNDVPSNNSDTDRVMIVARWLAMFSLAAIPGGGGFFLWRQAIVQMWSQYELAGDWAVWIVIAASAIVSVGCVMHATEYGRSFNSPLQAQHSSSIASVCSRPIIVWGFAAVAAGIFPWMASGSTDGRPTENRNSTEDEASRSALLGKASPAFVRFVESPLGEESSHP